MIYKQLIDLAVHFAIRQLAKYSKTVKWDLVKADLKVRIADIIPGEFFDEVAVTTVNKAIDLIAAFTANDEVMNKLVDLLQEKRFSEAVITLRDYVVSELKL